MSYEMSVSRAYDLGFLAMHKLIGDLNINDEFKAYLMIRYYDEYDGLNNLDDKELVKLAILVNYKYKDVNESCKDYVESVAGDYSFLDEINEIEELGIYKKYIKLGA